MSKALIIGDLFLDRYIYGTITRMNPESVQPLMRYENEEDRLGGAGNIAASIASLGCGDIEVWFAGPKYAHQYEHAYVESLLYKFKIQYHPISCDDAHILIRKSRYIGNQQYLLRVDHEPANITYSSETLLSFYSQLRDFIIDFDIIVFSDYNKGIFSSNFDILQEFINSVDKPIIMDPKKPWFTKLLGLHTVLPNKNELELTGIQDAAILARHMKCVVLNTVGEEGIMFARYYPEDNSSSTLQIKSKHTDYVKDVCGAGDAVTAAYSVAILRGKSPLEAAKIANKAGAAAVGHLGAYILQPHNLEDLYV